ncbi:nitroreductase family protein [Marinobacter halophilus]|uniref:Putative NAD(P)H nitroreductase n=1 Tax=Marinobacter halophilus TaxID=1323740 RepID=A0A2T1KIG3_9GAMM|nr:nitroreductase [Marinobacter halophilus]PSF09382.1 nitroreductase [Marinobacter halophilus]GGC78380.1 nitroreductase [Marinobacter halophilus]
MTSVTRFLLDKTSEPRLQAPAPARDVVDTAFKCAARAPDHALLRPWRYLVIEGDALEALGELFAQTCPDGASEQELEKARRAPLRAPMVIVGIASPRMHPKVPEVEQLMSAAAGMSFLSLALTAAGYGVMWRTGGVAYHPAVYEGLGLRTGESVVGFMYTGTVVNAKPPVPRPDTEQFVAVWSGPGRSEAW